MLNINKFANYSNDNHLVLSDKAIDQLEHNLAVGDESKGINDLLILINTVANAKNYSNDNSFIELYKIEFNPRNKNDWDDSGYDNPINEEKQGEIIGHIKDTSELYELDLSTINNGATLKNDVKKVAPYNKNLMNYYQNDIKPLKNNHLYIIESTNNGLNKYRELTRSELVSIAFYYGDLYNMIKDNDDWKIA